VAAWPCLWTAGVNPLGRGWVSTGPEHKGQGMAHPREGVPPKPPCRPAPPAAGRALLLNLAGHRIDQRAAQRILYPAANAVHWRHPRLTPHLLRHTSTTLALDAGVPQDQIQHDGG
jgi:integrase